MERDRRRSSLRKETRSLIRWDRISRPGLYQEGDPTAPAVYAYCLLKNE